MKDLHVLLSEGKPVRSASFDNEKMKKINNDQLKNSLKNLLKAFNERN